jgi:hypothetical protein
LTFFDDIKIWNQFLQSKNNKLVMAKYFWKK